MEHFFQNNLVFLEKKCLCFENFGSYPDFFIILDLNGLGGSFHRNLSTDEQIKSVEIFRANMCFFFEKFSDFAFSVQSLKSGSIFAIFDENLLEICQISMVIRVGEI